ncbi:MAG: CotH kinase family protein [Bacteroidaceae bacterium]|nr:CotH kinase family protein [Bacteroidaceae bacterium]
MRIKIFMSFFVLWIAMGLTVYAQERYHIHFNDWGANWDFSYTPDSIINFDFSKSGKTLQGHTNGGITIPFDVGLINKVSFDEDPEVETKNGYRVFALYINTLDAEPVISKEEYVDCFISIDAKGEFSNYSARGKIRGRGNSSFKWYDKKPYRIKLDDKHKILGLDKAKKWVLLANYRDVTDLMNTFVFEMAEWMGMPYTNHTRYAEVFLNGDYIGLYQITEQIEQGSNRVNISKDKGLLLALDQDDGPELSPDANDNFYTSVYRMPMAVKYPDEEDLNVERLDSIKEVFATLERAIKSKDYDTASSLMDMESFIRYLIIQEFVYNVELSAPRSIYLYKDGDGKFFFGPVWDWDAGYDFNWNDMYTGHTFFRDYRETVMGSNPLKQNGNYKLSGFFTDLFACKPFVQRYKEVWNTYSDSIVSRNWSQMEKYLQYMNEGPLERDLQRFPISGFKPTTETAKMKKWLDNRRDFIDNLINNIPEPQDVKPIEDEEVVGSLTYDVELSMSNGYHQDVQVNVDFQQFCKLLNISVNDYNENNIVDIVPINPDGTVGSNTAAGTYGAWFSSEGYTTIWGNDSHVFIEISGDLFNWTCGCHPDICEGDDKHTVMMQYQYQTGSTLKKVNVVVNFTIADDGGWWWPWW